MRPAPVALSRALALEDVDRARALDCAQYDGCLTKMRNENAASWRCPRARACYEAGAPLAVDPSSGLENFHVIRRSPFYGGWEK